MPCVLSFLVLTLLHVSFAVGFAQCYYPDGSIPVDYIWEPCTGSKFSSCCVPSEGDICQADGSCYYPSTGFTYRGTCTDQTWNDPACNVNTCVSGFETTWQWLGVCIASGSTSTVCGSMSETAHVTPTCSGAGVLQTSNFVSTTSTTSARRYTPPPSIDTARFSVETDTYTTIITAFAQGTTITSTFQSTITNTLSQAGSPAATGTNTNTNTASQTRTGTSSESTSSSSATPQKKDSALSTGIIIAIALGGALILTIAILAYLLYRKRAALKKAQSLKLETPYPPANGPVGADQVHPYEAPVNEVSPGVGMGMKKYAYVSPKVESHEMDDRTAMLREKRDGDGDAEGRVEMHADEHGNLRSPAPTYRGPGSPAVAAPAYQEAVMPVELDGTSSFRGGYERY